MTEVLDGKYDRSNSGLSPKYHYQNGTKKRHECMFYETFQNLTIGEVDLAHFHLLHSSSLRFKEVSYDLGKIFEYLNNSSYPLSMIDYHLK